MINEFTADPPSETPRPEADLLSQKNKRIAAESEAELALDVSVMRNLVFTAATIRFINCLGGVI
jgi:hypothetical protein